MGNVNLLLFILTFWGQLVDLSTKDMKDKKVLFQLQLVIKKVVLMQMWVESTHWLLLKRDTIPTKHLINRKGDIGIFLSLYAYVVRKTTSWKG